MRAQVIVLAGPSGSGKSRLAARTGLPVLRLDDFYKDGSDPTLPVITVGANAGMVDWDHVDAWHLDDALAAITALCREGHTQVPIYDIAHDGRTGWRDLDLGEHRLFVAEGIFAELVARPAAEQGLLAAAYCIRRHPLVTFALRLTRDLRERRKPPLVLLRRGLDLMRGERRVVARAEARGCRPVTPEQGLADIRALETARPR
ncbi:ATP-binding protein [Nocardioides sp. dk4132]|uniref:ATP-binding protein n=1 Tax=unclassified Nocardioides TaxID=2615069 RepID=UPI0012962BEB|nr:MULTISPECIES: ATP-binding protein [unclassified Nocardioides]MQW75921.1 ATP-binding protein [Nocardioides sp. dk4132]QGA08782.1 ATP-binding protein [Nocardioides sp. dk884]